MEALRHLLSRLDDLDAEHTIFAAEPWGPDSAAEAADASDGPSSEGLVYLLEVDLARDVVEVWSAWRDGRQPTVEEACDAVVHYAVNDAYQPTD